MACSTSSPYPDLPPPFTMPDAIPTDAAPSVLCYDKSAPSSLCLEKHTGRQIPKQNSRTMTVQRKSYIDSSVRVLPFDSPAPAYIRTFASPKDDGFTMLYMCTVYIQNSTYPRALAAREMAGKRLEQQQRRPICQRRCTGAPPADPRKPPGWARLSGGRRTGDGLARLHVARGSRWLTSISSRRDTEGAGAREAVANALCPKPVTVGAARVHFSGGCHRHPQYPCAASEGTVGELSDCSGDTLAPPRRRPSPHSCTELRREVCVCKRRWQWRRPITVL